MEAGKSRNKEPNWDVSFFVENFKYSSGFYWILQRVLPDLTRGREQTQTPEKSAVKEKKEKSETETDLVP